MATPKTVLGTLPFPSIRFILGPYLPNGTIVVSPDVWATMLETWDEKGRDRAFLRELGIIAPGSPGEPGEQNVS